MKPESREDMEPRQRRFRNSEFGFSIIEIVFVVAMIGILGSMAVIQLQPSIDRYRLVSSANMIASEMNAGRALAISRNWAYEAQFDTIANTIQVVDPSHSSNNPRMAKSLEPGISFSFVPSPSIRFYARGHALTGTILLQNDAGETASVIVTPYGVNVIL
ncbi:MAG: hypothetical protein IH794_09300 [Acidobacteria bacterium]|nr:hypothetical protein [Acidobacteriota bacterium]